MSAVTVLGRESLPRVLCVDDEPQLLEGLRMTLRRHFEVMTATGAELGLALLERTPQVSVVLSDMRMPGMNGAAFLSKVKELAPEATRMLLTGQADLDSAMSAINDGGIFRFLTKPCERDLLISAMTAAVAQNALVRAEKVLLEETLQGSIRTLTDVLAMVQPKAFGRALRLRRTVRALAEALDVQPAWQLEVAAMLGQLGYVNFPEDTMDRLHRGAPLSDAETRRMVEAPAMTEALLGHIPRMEQVRKLILMAARAATPGEAARRFSAADNLERGARLLRLSAELDTLELQGSSSTGAIETLRKRAGVDPVVLEALAQLCAVSTDAEVKELPVAALAVGMVCAADVRLQGGMLLVARGFEINAGFLERVRHYAPGTVQEPVRVRVPQALPSLEGSREKLRLTGLSAKEGRAS